ncbi:MAG: damage-inducible protein D [Magnetococcales bacterium]|nr:damage-inducible protein D [Magnetococcales bacterium]
MRPHDEWSPQLEANDVAQGIVPFEDQSRGFEGFAKINGATWWYASDLARMLGYSGLKPFMKAVEKAMAVCMTLDIPLTDNIQEEFRMLDGSREKDFRLTRFACYLSVMNADISKPLVARAQGYFSHLAAAFHEHFRNSDDVQRVQTRGEVTLHEKSLSRMAYMSGVENFAFFQDAGYRGMYNMSLRELREYKGHDGSKKPLLDFMGTTELAANLFRITQTEEKIRREGIHGQFGLENAAAQAGMIVRKTMQEISGQRPEDLPLADDIQRVKSGIKRTHKEFQKMDKPSAIASRRRKPTEKNG